MRLALIASLLAFAAAADDVLPAISEPGKILMSPSWVHPSHKMVMMELASALQKRGHKVVVWQIGLQKDEVGDYRFRQTRIVPVPKGVEERFWPVTVEEPFIRDMLLHRNASVYDHIWEERIEETQKKAANWMMSLRMCELILEKQKNKFDALVKEHFDAVIIDDLYNPCGLLHTGLQKSLFVYYSMTNFRTETAWGNQSPSPPSYIPVPGTGYTDIMDFWQRAANMLAYLKTIYIHQRIVLRRLDAVFQAHYPDANAAFYMERNASLNFINTPPIFDFTRPYMPRTTFVGGLHCRNATGLPKGKLADFVNSADASNGFVYINMGMAVQWDRAPAHITNAFLGLFKSQAKTKFVWVNGSPPSSLPSNVYTAKWLPQQELLGHKKCKAFITGGGLNSVVESLFHNTPVIGIPLFAEYRDNMMRVTERDAGVILDKTFVSEKTLIRAVNKVRSEERLIEGTQHFSDLIHDVPYTELNHAVFWVEFMIRHKEIPQARSGADDLNIFQYFLVDVIAFLAACVFLVMTIIYYSIKFTLKGIWWLVKKCFFSSASKKPAKKTKAE